jgi:hypothetical protein
MYQGSLTYVWPLLLYISFAQEIVVYTADIKQPQEGRYWNPSILVMRLAIYHSGYFYHLFPTIRALNEEYKRYFKAAYPKTYPFICAVNDTTYWLQQCCSNVPLQRPKILRSGDKTASYACYGLGANNMLRIRYVNNLSGELMPQPVELELDVPNDGGLDKYHLTSQGTIVTYEKRGINPVLLENLVFNDRIRRFVLVFKVQDKFFTAASLRVAFEKLVAQSGYIRYPLHLEALVRNTGDQPRCYLLHRHQEDAQEIARVMKTVPDCLKVGDAGIAVVHCANNNKFSQELWKDLYALIAPRLSFNIPCIGRESDERQRMVQFQLLSTLSSPDILRAYFANHLYEEHRYKDTEYYFVVNNYRRLIYFRCGQYIKKVLLPAEAEEGNRVNAFVRRYTGTSFDHRNTDLLEAVYAFFLRQRQFIIKDSVAVYVDALARPCVIRTWAVHHEDHITVGPAMTATIDRSSDEQLAHVALYQNAVALLFNDFPIAKCMYAQRIVVLNFLSNLPANLLGSFACTVARAPEGAYAIAAKDQVVRLDLGPGDRADQYTLYYFYKVTTALEQLFPRFGTMQLCRHSLQPIDE